MNRSSRRITTIAKTPTISRRFGAGVLALTATAASFAISAGCGGKDNFAKVNGQAITRDEYIRALERQQVAVPGGQATSAERFVLDKLIGDKVVLAEAAKMNVLPTDEDVNRLYEVQKRLWESQFPGKEYEKTMTEQGGSPEDTKSDLRSALAETAVFAKRLNVTEDEVRKAYSDAKGNFGLPARVQLRLIVVAPNSPQFNEAKKMLASKSAFDEAAKKLNVLPQLKATGGLMAQATPVQSIPPVWQSKIQQTAEGAFFGPVDFAIAQGQPPAKAWVKVEKKLPALTLPYEDARGIVRRQLVQAKMMQPENARFRQELMKQKMEARFEATEDNYESVWNAYKDAAKAAGVGEVPAAATPTAPAAAGLPTVEGGAASGGAAAGAGATATVPGG